MNYDFLKITHSENKLSLKKIENFEKINNFKLPNEYKSFLLKYNGGMPENPYFYCDKTKNQGQNLVIKDKFINDLASFFLLDLDRMKLEIKRSIFKGKDYIPIGADIGSTSLCIFIRGKNYGKVCFWRYTFDVTEDDYSFLYYLADSFDSYLEQLIDGEKYESLLDNTELLST